jgi:hypothetical protein
MKPVPKIATAAMAAVLLLFLLFQSGLPAGTGLMGMGKDTAQGAGEGQKQTAQQTKAEEKGQSLSAEISFRVLKKTRLSAKLVGAYNIKNCPEETAIELEIENSGNATAKRVSVRLPAPIKVKACKNCEIEAIAPKRTVEAEANICRQTAKEVEIEVIAANAEAVKVRASESH